MRLLLIALVAVGLCPRRTTAKITTSTILHTSGKTIELHGASLYALGQVLDVLVTTGVEPTLARSLLRDGGHGVLMFAGAASPWARRPAHRFLRVVSGRDHSGDLAAWSAWIASV